MYQKIIFYFKLKSLFREIFLTDVDFKMKMFIAVLIDGTDLSFGAYWDGKILWLNRTEIKF